MSQLYFTSSLISSQRFLSLEQLFEHIEPKDALFVFDTNLVVYYKELFLNSKKFISNENNKNIYYSIRYLIEQISRYDLEINASIGVEECCRSKNDFKLNLDKVNQTHRAIMSMFKMDINSLDEYIKKEISEDVIMTDGEYSLSKIASLKEVSSFQNLVTISYLASLKIFTLQNKIEENQLTPTNAHLEFLDFMMVEVDCIAGTILMYALHLFGGVNEFKLMLMAKGKVSKEEKLHKLFNGAIDLIFPYIVNKAQELYPIPHQTKKIIPVLVTADRRLATLHSLLNTKLILESNTEGGVNYNPELIEIGYYGKMIWTDADFNLFKERTQKDLAHRLESAMSTGKTAIHLLPLIEQYENEVINLF